MGKHFISFLGAGIAREMVFGSISVSSVLTIIFGLRFMLRFLSPLSLFVVCESKYAE